MTTFLRSLVWLAIIVSFATGPGGSSGAHAREQTQLVPKLPLLGFWPLEVAVSNDAAVVLVVNRSGRLDLFDRTLGAEPVLIRSVDAAASTVAISADGQTIVSDGYDRTVRILRTKNVSGLRTLYAAVESRQGPDNSKRCGCPTAADQLTGRAA